MFNLKKYNEVYSHGKKKKFQVVGDASITSMFDRKTMKRIYNTFGKKMKLIFLLRNPVDRAISAYWHKFRKADDRRKIEEVFNYESGNLDKVIAKENIKLNKSLAEQEIFPENNAEQFDDLLLSFRYIKNSYYSKNIKNILSDFDKEKCLFLITEELKENPKHTYRKIENFLGIDDKFTPKNLEKKHKQTKVPLFPFIEEMISDINIQFPFKKSLVKAYIQFRSFTDKPKPETSDNIKTYLEHLFKEEKRSMTELINEKIKKYW